MKKIYTYSLFTFFLLLFLPLISHAHVHLDKSQPAKDEVLTTAPTAVHLWFSGKVEAEWSKVEVKDSLGKRVDNTTVTAIDNDDKTLQVDLKALTPGSYDVRWNVVAGDGHRIKGGISFKVE